MNSIIHYLLIQNQYLFQIISFLLNFICKFVPLRQFSFDDSNSPNYQKFKTDKLPVFKTFQKLDYEFLIEYYKWRYNKYIKPINSRNGKEIPSSVVCPRCGAPHNYIYDNNGNKGAYLCKLCNQTFGSATVVTKPLTLHCPYCNHKLVPKKERKHFTVHKCVNTKCSYYLHNLKKVKKQDLDNVY